MQPWLVDKLDGDGVLDKNTRLTHKPRPRRCLQCGVPVLAAMDDLGQPAYLEPVPVNNAGELKALMTGRPTYALDHGAIYTRNHWHIRGRPADTEPTYAEHACGAPLPSRPPRPRPAATDHPPF